MAVRNQVLADSTTLKVYVSLERFNKLSSETLKELDSINIWVEVGGLL